VVSGARPNFMKVKPVMDVLEARRVLRYGVEPRRPDLWDGCAAQRIAGVLTSGKGS
jgi:hypothetical protein